MSDMSSEIVPEDLKHEYNFVMQRVEYTSIVLNDAQQEYNQAIKDQEAFFIKMMGRTAVEHE
jgi:hypothetical protein